MQHTATSETKYLQFHCMAFHQMQCGGNFTLNESLKNVSSKHRAKKKNVYLQKVNTYQTIGIVSDFIAILWNIYYRKIFLFRSCSCLNFTTFVRAILRGHSKNTNLILQLYFVLEIF